ncbi:hypothetical protein BH10ACT6_BH10ACT6_11520 [soil metagenome]
MAMPAAPMTAQDATPRSPRAPRRTVRRAALDPRLVLGVLLVVGSVAGVVGIVSGAERRVTVYVAASALTPGERIDRGDLVERAVALDGADRLYLGRGDIPSGGLVMTQPVAKGQLLPTSAVGSSAGVRTTSIVLRLATRVSGAVVPGASVDLWAVPKAGTTVGAGGPDEADASLAPTVLVPTVLVGRATVSKVFDASGSFAVDSAGSQVEVLVPRNTVARVLQAIADGDALALLPAGIPLDLGSGTTGSGS